MIAIIAIITTVTAILVINTIYITIFIISVTVTIIIIMMSPPLTSSGLTRDCFITIKIVTLIIISVIAHITFNQL